MRIKRFLVLLLFCLKSVAAGAGQAQDVPNPLTLSQAVSIALSNSTALRLAQSRLNQAAARSAQARAVLLPQVEGYASQTLLTIDLQGLGIEIPNVTQEKSKLFGSLDAGFALTQDLLNIANLESWKSTRSRQDSARLMLENAREVVVLDVVASYLQALRAKASRDTVTEQVKLAEELYKATSGRAEQGGPASLDANRAQQQVNAFEQQRQEAEQNYIAAKLSLANLLELRITADFEVEDAGAYIPEAGIDREAALSSALGSRSDYRAAQAEIRAAELQVQSVQAHRLPVLSATFGDEQSGDSPVHNQNTYRLEGMLYIPIFTSGRIRGEIHEAQAVLREAQENAEQLRSQIETDVLTAMAGVEWARKEVETSAANVRLSREEVELTRQRFTRGVTDNTEVVNAQDRVSRADEARVRAMYALGLARANLARAMGAAERTYRK